MFNLFSSKPLLDKETRQWLVDAYAWALRSFGSDFFYEDTLLVTPTKEHFPTEVNSRSGMASSIFNQMVHYAGMQNWPLELIELTPDYEPAYPSSTRYNGIPRGPATELSLEGESGAFQVTYSTNLTKDPSVLTTVLARQLAAHLISASDSPGPGGKDLQGHLVDLVAIFMGFGLFLTNNAVFIPRGCSGCGSSVQATGYLSEDQMIYALAVFCHLKNSPNKIVLPHLKSPLRPVLKKALKEIRSDSEIEPLTHITNTIKLASSTQ